MERNRNDGVRTGQDLCSGAPHPRTERPRDRLTSVVLQRVDDGSERAFVRSNRASSRDERPHPAAPYAPRFSKAHEAPRRQRIAARLTARRSDWHDRRPASGANRAASRLFERLAAGRADRSEQDGQNTIGGALEHALDRSRQRGASSAAGSLETVMRSASPHRRSSE